MINTYSQKIPITFFRKHIILYQGNRSGLKKPKTIRIRKRIRNSITHSYHHIDTVFEEMSFSGLAKKVKEKAFCHNLLKEHLTEIKI